MRALLGLAAAALLSIGLAGSASAIPMGFDCITNNIPGDCTIGEAQLAVDVTNPGGGQVLFTFTNAGPSASSITDIYFDDGSLLGIASILNGAGTSFSQPATPGELPGANNASPPFVTTSNFSADSSPPVQPNGVNPGESVGILFNLVGGKTFADVVNELTSGTLRVGIHVQGYTSGGSESLVNLPIPEPSSLALLGLGVGVLTAAFRRR